MANAIGTIYALDQCNCLYICTGKAIDDIRTQLVDSYYKALLKMLRYNFIQKCRVQTHYHQFVTLLQMTAPWPTTLREWQMTGPKAWNPDQSETLCCHCSHIIYLQVSNMCKWTAPITAKSMQWAKKLKNHCCPTTSKYLHIQKRQMTTG